MSTKIRLKNLPSVRGKGCNLELLVPSLSIGLSLTRIKEISFDMWPVMSFIMFSKVGRHVEQMEKRFSGGSDVIWFIL